MKNVVKIVAMGFASFVLGLAIAITPAIPTSAETKVETPNIVDYRGVDMAGRDFSGQDLSGYDFRGCDLRGCNFSNCNLAWADFRGAICTGAIFVNTDCTGTEFRGAILCQCDFRGANMNAADLRGASADGIGTDWSGVDFTNTWTEGATFDYANMEGCVSNYPLTEED